MVCISIGIYNLKLKKRHLSEAQINEILERDRYIVGIFRMQLRIIKPFVNTLYA